MKYSQFNSILSFEGKYALFNAKQQKVIFLEELLKDMLTAAINEGIDDLIQFHPKFYKYLVEQHFLIDESIDEVEEIKQISKQVDENMNDFLLIINPSMNCNFACWYCYETHVKQSKLNSSMIEKINKFIGRTTEVETLKNFYLSFFGGEPLLYFKTDVIPIIDFFVERCKQKQIGFNIGFTTNGYLINQQFIDYFKKKNIFCSLQITLDGYKDHHDTVRFVSAKKGSYDEIVKNIKLLVSNGLFVNLRVNYTEKNIADAHKIAYDLSDLSSYDKDNFLVIDFHRVWQTSKLDDINIILNQNIAVVRGLGFQVSNHFSADAVNNSCYADKRNSAVINFNGDIYKCTARDFISAKRAGYLDDDGHLIWENDHLEKRMNLKFKNKPCLKCRILPLCNGGCSQVALENLGIDYCVYSGNEKEKDKVILSKISDLMQHRKNTVLSAV